MNTQEFKTSILGVYNDPMYQALQTYYSKTSLFQILGIERNENRHSRFIKWLLDPMASHQIGDAALRKLLGLYAIKAKLPEFLSIAFVTGKYELMVDEITTEKVISLKNTNKRIDIWALMRVEADEQTFIVPMIIENKVTSEEHDEQTQDYHQWLLNYQKQLANESKNETIGIYLNNERKDPMILPIEIFLAPDNIKDCACNEYVRISYQELLDYVIEPLLQTIMSEDAKNIVLDYVRTLSRPVAYQSEDGMNKNAMSHILAVSKQEESLLKKLYLNHKNLFDAAIYSNGEDRLQKLIPEYECLIGTDAYSQQIKLLTDFWVKNQDLILTVQYVCSDDISKCHGHKLRELLQSPFAKRNKYIVEVLENGNWQRYRLCTSPVSQGRAVAYLFEAMGQKRAYQDIDELRKIFPVSLNSNYGRRKDKSFASIVWEDDGRNHDKVKDENGYAVKITEASWDFYEDCGTILMGNNRTAHIVKMWRNNDFDTLLRYINQHSNDHFYGVRIVEASH